MSAGVAIVGMGCRLPGANTPAELWNLLRDGIDATGEKPPDHPPHDETGALGRLITRRGGFLRGIDQFDPYFFGISPRDAAGLDPQQRLLFESAWRAAEDAGVSASQLREVRTGVFVALASDDYQELLREQSPEAEFQVTFSSIRANGPGRLSHALGLSGPSLTVDTACSSSLVAVHLAVRALQAGDCELALAGGANAILQSSITRAYMRGGLLSPDGKCQAFSERANGFVRSEGGAMVLLKRLDRAVHDRDRIYAVIRGSAVNNDGGSSPFLMPSRLGQVRAIRSACTEAGISPADLAYVETHGTGTVAGDPIEVGALSDALAGLRPVDRPVRIGSCKTNLGHLEAAAGVTGLMKAALAVYHGAIPPSLHAEVLNPAIPWDLIPISVQRCFAEWPAGARKLAGVNSFGIFGTNAHVVLEGTAGSPAEEPVASSHAGRNFLLPLSARDDVSLGELAKEWGQTLLASPAPLADLCYTAALRRTHFDHRLVASGATAEHLNTALEAWLAGDSSAPVVSGQVRLARESTAVFVFSGVGSHWPRMAAGLFDSYPVFREALERADSAVRRLSNWSVIEEIRRDKDSSRLDAIEIGQPAQFAVQIALSELWNSWGVQPGIVIGHSLGEIAAAYISGALSIEDAARVVLARSELMASLKGRCGMLACGITPEEGAKAIRGFEDRVAIGVVNSYRSIVLSGDQEVLDRIAQSLEGSGVFFRRVKTRAATHGPHVDPILKEFEKRIAGIQPRQTSVPLCSTVTGDVISGGELTPRYWVANLRGQVLFGPAFEKLIEQGKRLFLEVSPHPLLVNPMQEGARELAAACLFVPSLRREEDSQACLNASLSRLFTAGYPVDWEALVSPSANFADVPGHPFRKERIWLASDGGGRYAEQAFARITRRGAHPLLPLRFDLADKPGVHVWEGTLDPTDHPFLTQHLAQGERILPAAAYYELAYAISTEILGPRPITLGNVQLRRALFVPSAGTVRIQAVLTRSGTEYYSLRFYSGRHKREEACDWQICCEMTLREGAEETEPGHRPQPPLDSETAWDSGAFYALTQTLGIEYGPLYQGVERAWLKGTESLAQLAMPLQIQQEKGFHIHPAFLDTVVQLPFLPFSRVAKSGTAFLPVSVDEVYFARGLSAGERLWAEVRVYDGLNYDATLKAEDGSVIFRVRKAACRAIQAAASKSSDFQPDWIYDKRWEPSSIPTPASVEPGEWLLIGTSSEAQALGALLESHGARWRAGDGAADGDLSVAGIAYLRALSRPVDEEPAGPQKELCEGLLRLLQSGSGGNADFPGKLIVAARGVNLVQAGDRIDLRAGPLFGLARTAGSEFPRLHVTTVDLDPNDLSCAALIPEMLGSSAETEVAYRGGQRFAARIGRLQLDSLGRRRKRISLDSKHNASYRVVSPAPGSVDRVGLEAAERIAPGEDQIEVRVEAAGLNFLDVLKALNMGPGQQPGAASFGMEFCGVVSRAGPGVTVFRPGDRVMGLTLPGETCFQPWLTLPARLVFPAPKQFSAAQAASCLVAYQTAWYALAEVGRLGEGDKVLIHAAAGGVGLAAVHIAQHLGTEIFATAGSQDKREYLRSLGVRHLMNSRNLDFAEEVLAASGQRGVDAVLNSISGAAIPKSIATLAHGGRFLEIGKRDIYANASLDLLPFRNNLSYHAIDMLGLTASREQFVIGLTRRVVDLLSSGVLPPLPVISFPATRAADAFRHIVESRHIGKVVLTFDENPVEVEIPREQLIRGDASYLITGGMSGIGLECAKWLASRGARHLILAGRGAPSPAAAKAIQSISQSGVAVRRVIGDVGDPAAVKDLVRSTPPLAGIIHSAGLARDGIIERLKWKQFEEVFAPKIGGTWNLHSESLAEDLDFFVQFSSVASWMGAAGQGNYAAANAFVDSIGDLRQAHGLPVLTISWGPWTGLGMLERHKLRPAPIFGEQGIRPEQGIACLSALLEKDCARATVMSADWTSWPQDAPLLAGKALFADFRSAMAGGQSAGSSTAALAAEVANLPKAEGIALVRSRVVKEVVAVLRISEDRLDDRTSLQNLGLDSLMAVELAARLESSLGLPIQVMSLLQGPSLEELAAALFDRLKPDNSPAPQAPNARVALASASLVRRSTTISRGRSNTWVVHEQGTRLPLFCLGGVHEWLAAASQLGEDQPIVGVLPARMGIEARPELKDFAAACVTAIREHQPRGPYALAGWSVWGVVALEAAHQLTAASEEVGALAIADAFLPLASRGLNKMGQWAAWADLEKKRLGYHVRKLRRGEADLNADFLKDRLKAFTRFRLKPMMDAAQSAIKPAEPIQSAKDYGDLLLAASMKYQALPYSGRVLLASAADRHEGSPESYAAEWKSVLTGDVTLVVVPGDHMTMLYDAENVQTLVGELRNMLDRIG